MKLGGLSLQAEHIKPLKEKPLMGIEQYLHPLSPIHDNESSHSLQIYENPSWYGSELQIGQHPGKSKLER